MAVRLDAKANFSLTHYPIFLVLYWISTRQHAINSLDYSRRMITGLHSLETYLNTLDSTVPLNVGSNPTA